MANPHLEAAVRRGMYRDLDKLVPIYKHYVSSTILTLDLDTNESDMEQLYNSVLNQDMPFLVVTLSNDHNPTNSSEDILGYAYARGYRPLPVFGGTVEIQMYLHPDAIGRGIGKNLLSVMMAKLKAVRPATGRESGIKEVLAIVPVDEGRDASGFFLKYGFEDRGSLQRIAWKMGRWIDMRYLQRSLHQRPEDEEKTVQQKRDPLDRAKAVQKKKEPARHWWSSLFRRRRRRMVQN